MKFLRALAFALLLLAPLPAVAQQSSPGWTYGYVPTPAEWSFWFAKKVDWAGASYCPTTGCTFTGPVLTPASTAIGAGLNVPPGVAPTLPNNGDIWTTASGIFVQINGATVGPLISSGAPSLTAPVVITGSNANALAVGPNGTTNPTLQVNDATASTVTGLQIQGAPSGSGVSLTALSSATNDGLTINAKGTGSISIGTGSTGGVVVGNASTGSFTVQSVAAIFTTAGNQSLIVGPNGATNPTLQVDDSVASSATGLYVQSHAAGNGVLLAAISSATNENLTISSKGSGTTVHISPTTIQSASANAFAVTSATASSLGLNIDMSTASAVTGLGIKSAAAGGGVAVTTYSTGTNESVTLNAKGSGTISIGNVSTGNVVVGNAAQATITTGSGGVSIVSNATTIQGTGAGAFVVGPNGPTNPTFNIDTSTASAATGLNIKAAAAGGGLAVTTISSGTNENLTIDAKGTGTISIGTGSLGAVNIALGGGGVTVSSLVSNGAIISSSASGGIGYTTGVGAGGAVTQTTSRTTAVTLNKITGEITLFAAAPTVGTWVSFTVNDSVVAAVDTVHLSVKSGTNTYIALVSAVAAGSFQITFQSVAGTSSDSPVISYAVIKSSAN